MKSLHEDDITGKLRDRLSRYEEVPSDNLWNKIEATRGKSAGWTAWVEPISLLAIGALMALMILPRQNTNDLVTTGVSAKAASTENVVQPKITAAHTRVEQLHINNDRRSAPTTTSSENESPARQSLEAKPVHTALSAISWTDEALTNEGGREVIAETHTDSSATFSPAKPQAIVKPKLKKEKRLQAYLIITPSLAFNKMIPQSHDFKIVEGFAYRPSMSAERSGFAVDAGFQKEVTSLIGVFGGVSFYRQQQQLTYEYLENEVSLERNNDVFSIILTPKRNSHTFNYSMTNIGVRTGVLMTLKGNKLRHRFGAGIAWQHGFAGTGDGYDNRQSWYLMGQLLYRSEYRINDSFSFLVEPSFGYALISHEKLAEPFKLKPYRVGAGVGMLYRF
jgi:hypothetical protein